MIVCGWCGKPAGEDRCASCGHIAPGRPWTQRGEEPPTVAHEPGRPALDGPAVRRRLADARRALEQGGRLATVDALAEVLDVSPRTVRRWQQMAV